MKVSLSPYIPMAISISIYWRRKKQPTQAVLPGESGGAWWAPAHRVAKSQTRLK